jgi:quinoprotein relay system zinc metallohydrolase 2
MGAAEPPRIALWLSASFWMAACAPASAADARGGFNLSEPRPGVFVHVGRPLALDAPGHDDIANIGFIVGKKCVAVIDTGGSVRIGRELRAAVADHTALPVCYVINTHVHVDHVLGNAAFSIDKPQYVGHARLADEIARSRDFFVKEYAGDFAAPASADQVIGPDRLVEHELALDLGGRELALRAWPRAHTDSDLTVYDMQTNTLWTGDLLFRERLPALDGSVKGWLAALEEIGGLKAGLTVPGHGRPTRDLASAVAAERLYLKALMDGVRSEIAQSRPLEDAIERVAAAQKSHWMLWDTVHPHNVVRAYQELEWD